MILVNILLVLEIGFLLVAIAAVIVLVRITMAVDRERRRERTVTRLWREQEEQGRRNEGTDRLPNLSCCYANGGSDLIQELLQREGLFQRVTPALTQILAMLPEEGRVR